MTEDILSHYEAIKLRLAHSIAGEVVAKTESDRIWHEHNTEMISKELGQEIEFIKKKYGFDPTPVVLDEEDERILSMNDDEILKALGL